MEALRVLRGLLIAARGVRKGLPSPDPGADPLELFHTWFAEADRAGLYLPEAVTLATAGRDGRPSARLVLVKDATERGFSFYTNLESRKARELAENPWATLVFHWAVLQRQVRIEGLVERLPEAEAETYWRTRPRGSQLGAWVSTQSAPLDERANLLARVEEARRRFGGGEVPLPPFWGGYRLVPERIEFWQGRADRLHDRVVFTRSDGGWAAGRLQP